jgi:hypothetical protein
MQTGFLVELSLCYHKIQRSACCMSTHWLSKLTVIFLALLATSWAQSNTPAAAVALEQKGILFHNLPFAFTAGGRGPRSLPVWYLLETAASPETID